MKNILIRYGPISSFSITSVYHLNTNQEILWHAENKHNESLKSAKCQTNSNRIISRYLQDKVRITLPTWLDEAPRSIPVTVSKKTKKQKSILNRLMTGRNQTSQP